MPIKRSFIGEALRDALMNLGGGYAQKIQREGERDYQSGLINQLQSGKDPRAPMSAGQMSGNLEQDAFQPRPMLDEKNLGILSQLPPQTLQLLMQLSSMNQPKYDVFGSPTSGMGYSTQRRGQPPNITITNPPMTEPTRNVYTDFSSGDPARKQSAEEFTRLQTNQAIQKAAALPSISSPVQNAEGVLGTVQTSKAGGASKFVPTGVQGKPTGGAKSQEQVQRLSALEANLNAYEKLLGDVQGGRVGGSVAKLEAMIEQNPQARTAQGLENNLAGLVARVINGEVGVLTDQDIERAKTSIPKITDTIEERKMKIGIMRQLLSDRKKAFSQTSVGTEKGLEQMSDDELMQQLIGK